MIKTFIGKNSITIEIHESLREIHPDFLKNAETPSHCPICGNIVLNTLKNDEGMWTWDCLEWCNP